MFGSIKKKVFLSKTNIKDLGRDFCVFDVYFYGLIAFFVKTGKGAFLASLLCNIHLRQSIK